MDILTYRYAEIQRGKEWKVVFYQVHPDTGKLTRVRLKVNRPDNKEAFAQRLCLEINKKLESGIWNYFSEKEGKPSAITIRAAVDKYLKHTEGKKRLATLNSYTSRMNRFVNWLAHQHPDIQYVHQVTPLLADQYFDHLVEQLRYKPITHNNALVDFRTFWNFLIKKQLAKENPFSGVSPLTVDAKRRVILSKEQLKRLFLHLEETDPHFMVACGLCYYCLIRRTEITRLRISNIDFDKQVVYVPGEISKTHQDRFCVIPDEFMQLLRSLCLDSYPPDSCIVGKSFRPGPKKTFPPKISMHFRKIADQLALGERVTFYSLKDTGVSFMSAAGFPLAIIRDQAGWKHLHQANTYLSVTREAVETVRKFTK